MRNYWLVLFFLLSSLSACKKESQEIKEDKKPDLTFDIAQKLNKADSIAVFTTSLQTIKLNEEETAQGITVFAPLNQVNSTAAVSINNKNQSGVLESSLVSPVPENIVKYHIVKGIYKLSDLTDGKILENMAGKELIVNRSLDGRSIFINGIPISGNAVLTNNNAFVYVVKEYFPHLEIIKPVELDEEGYSLALQRIENDIDLLHKNLVVLDGVLSHDVELNELPSVYRSKHRWFSNFSFNSSDALVKQVWESGYKCINYINVIEKQISKINNINQREEKIALLKGLKSYAYLQLLNYYGNIVVAPITFSLDAKLSNTDRQSVIDYINEELDYAIEKLGVPLQNKKLNVTALKVLKARLALLEKKYEIAKNLTQEILSEAQYSLEQPQSIFTMGSKEFIWNNSDHIDANIKSYFYNRDFLPYIRLTEVYLMNAEANYRLANTIQAKESFDVVALRSGRTLAFNLENLQQLWLNEMSREGASFIALVRWGTAIEKLGQYGFTSPKNNLLPIPMFELALNRYLIQNQGY